MYPLADKLDPVNILLSVGKMEFMLTKLKLVNCSIAALKKPLVSLLFEYFVAWVLYRSR